MCRLSTACMLIGVAAAMASSLSPVSCADYNPIVRTPADVDKLSVCNTMEGNIVIGQDFSGPFHLPGLSLIGNTLYGEPGFDTLADITEIFMPDLQFIIEGINLDGLTQLTTFDMPKLKSIGSGRQRNNPSPELTRITNPGGAMLNFSFPELESVSMTWFAGNIGKIDMPRLKTARFMYINSTAEFDCNALIVQLRDVDFRDGSLECHSNINYQGSDSGESGDVSGSFWSDFGDLMAQMVLEARRFVF